MMKHYKMVSVVLLISIFVVMVSACNFSGNTESATGKTEASTENVENTEEAAENQPKEEATNKLVVYSAGPGGLAEKILQGFIAKTGIEAEMFQATTGKVLARLEAEKSNPVVDVVVLASWPSAIGLKEQGMTQAYNPTNADKLYEDWKDADNHFFGYSASALGVTYNTLEVKEPPTDWSDFTAPEWKGKVNIPDPSLSGSALDFISGYIYKNGDSGWELFEALKQNEVAVAGANKEALAPVISGAKSAVLAGVDYMAYSAKAKGEPVDIIYPKSGTVINVRPAMIMKDAINVKNAQLFIDYLLSDEVQDMVADAYILPGRKDVKAKDRANVDEIPVFPSDFDWMMSHSEELLKRFEGIFK